MKDPFVPVAKPIVPSLPHFEVPRDYKLADTMYDRVAQAIKTFEEGLKPNEEVGAMLASFGQSLTVAIDSIGYHNPYLIKIFGTTADGHRCELLQHLSQVNILLVALPVTEDRPARRIGFKLVKAHNESK